MRLDQTARSVFLTEFVSAFFLSLRYFFKPKSTLPSILGSLSTPTKRKVYFAFRYKDIMRVNNVRQSGRIGFDEEKNPRDFYDRSILVIRPISQ